MKLLAWLPRARVAGTWRDALVIACWCVLGAWAIGILVAAWQLGTWRQELSRTLIQLNADAYFRARVQGREGVDPEWYRRKALSLLSATERLERDALWSVFIPGSWTGIDDLEEQVQARLGREFSDIVVETMRRELHARAARLTGVPLGRGSGELQGGMDCQAPVPRNAQRQLTAAPEDLPEFVAVRDYVQEVEGLDRAVQSFLSLQYSGGRPDQLRELVTYTLGKDLPGALESSVRMFQSDDEVAIQPALMQSRMQWVTRCALGKAMGALHTRLLNTNDLLALEQGFVERSAGLFDAARPASFDRTLERYRAVHALLEDQRSLLARGRNDWMRQASLQLGPGYQDVMRRIERMRLFGPEVVQQMQNQSGAAFAEFRRQFEEAFVSRGEPGIVWVDAEQRFDLSPQRAAMREGLAALLKTSFMAEEPAATAKRAPQGTSLAKVAQEARALAAERSRALAEIVPVFPATMRPVVGRVIDARVSELIYQRAFRTLKAALPAESQEPLDPALFRQQRDQVVALQAVLKETGGTALGERLAAALDGEVLRRLAPLQEEWRQQPLQAARIQEFGWWQGEPLPLAQALGAAETPAAPPTFARTAARLDPLVQQAKSLIALGTPALPDDPAAQRWLQLQSELDHYKARATDSSLLRLEKYLAALGSDLRRDNCAERLAGLAPPATADEIGQRHALLHQALASRCGELRAQAAAPAAAVTQ